MIDRAQRRLLLALGASALLHAWMVQTGDGPFARRVPAQGGAARITATLSAPPLDLTAPASESRIAGIPERGIISATEVKRGAATAAAPVAAERRIAMRGVNVTTDGAETLAQPRDPTYYVARSLDVYPRAITPLNLGAQAGAGKVRATVLIDESGAVNDVREVRATEAQAAEIEHAARELLLRTRFTPAAKDGRIVKAQVLVSLDYDAAQPAKRD